jgi:biotin carboxyl carrier protein
MKIYKVKVNGKTYRVELESVEEVASEKQVEVKADAKKEVKTVATGEGTPVLAPIQGGVINVKVNVGQTVKKGDVLVIIEAMKLENEVLSPVDGTVSEVLVSKGTNVTAKQPLLTIK